MIAYVTAANCIRNSCERYTAETTNKRTSNLTEWSLVVLLF